MTNDQNHRFPGPVTVFHERLLPEKATPAGYAALIDAYGLEVPLPRPLTATAEHHRVYEEDSWRILMPRHAPAAVLEGHLTFALKYEGLDLAVLKNLFEVAGPERIEAIVRATPTGTYARRIWFLLSGSSAHDSICPMPTKALIRRPSIETCNGTSRARTRRAIACATACPAMHGFSTNFSDLRETADWRYRRID